MMGFMTHILFCGAEVIKGIVMTLIERWIRVTTPNQKADERFSINMAHVMWMERDTKKNETTVYFTDGSDLKINQSMKKVTEALPEGGL